MKGSQSLLPGSEVLLRADRFAYGGFAVARHQGLVVFVDGALPGECVVGKITAVRSNHARARVVQVVEPSPHRRQPECPVFGECGGCQFLHVSYEHQMVAKTTFVLDAVRPLSGAAAVVRPIVRAPRPTQFRNRMSYSIVPGATGACIGFHGRSDWRTVVSAERCVLCRPWQGEVLRRTAVVLQRHDPEHWPRRLDLRDSANTGERMAVLCPAPPSDVLTEWIRRCGDFVNTVLVGEWSTKTGHPVNTRALSGRGWIAERLGRWEFRIDAETFFQTYPEQAEVMFDTAARWVATRKPGVVVELYAGVGAFTVFLADVSGRVIAVELDRACVRSARHNLERQGIRNANLVCADAADFRLSDPRSKPDVVVMDPPRGGLSRQARCAVMASGAPALLYVSCNPMTLGRDLAFFINHGYRLEWLQPFDLFPQTYHVECVAALTRA